jgi:hypothetical protein
LVFFFFFGSLSILLIVLTSDGGLTSFFDNDMEFLTGVEDLASKLS